MEINRKHITGGLYLVINPALEFDILLQKLAAALAGGIDIVQIWNNWPGGLDKLSFISKIASMCRPYEIPLLINQEWSLLLDTTDLDGVHFDTFPDMLLTIREAVARDIIIGVTCSGNLETVQLAQENKLDYISFCSMFPSSSAGSCAIVMPETVRLAGEITNLPIFISGGITPENAMLLKEKTAFDGIAVISGILSAKNPEKQARAYQNILNLKQIP